jgi:hypothetical protein
VYNVLECARDLHYFGLILAEERLSLLLAYVPRVVAVLQAMQVVVISVLLITIKNKNDYD